MARRIKRPSPGQRSPHIDWARWADGDWRRLTMGQDFYQDPRLALRAARTWGWRHGHRVSGNVSGDQTLDIRITPR